MMSTTQTKNDLAKKGPEPTAPLPEPELQLQLSVEEEEQESEEESDSEEIDSAEITSSKVPPYFAVGPERHDIICPLCKEKVTTSEHTKTYVWTCIYDCLRCLSCCVPIFWALCFLRPFIPGLNKTYQFCPKCDGYLGVYRRP